MTLTKTISFFGTLSSSMAAYRRRLSILSYAALKSINRSYVGQDGTLWHPALIYLGMDS